MKTIVLLLSFTLLPVLLMAESIKTTDPVTEAGFEIYQDSEGYKLNLTINKEKLKTSVEHYCHLLSIPIHNNYWEVHITSYLNDNFSLVMDDKRATIKVLGFVQFGDEMQVTTMLSEVSGDISLLKMDNTCFLENSTDHINLVRVNLNGKMHRLHLDAEYARVSLDYTAQDSRMIEYH